MKHECPSGCGSAGWTKHSSLAVKETRSQSQLFVGAKSSRVWRQASDFDQQQQNQGTQDQQQHALLAFELQIPWFVDRFHKSEL